MDKKIRDLLFENNFWEENPKSPEHISQIEFGIERSLYLKQILQFLDNELIKVLVGQRRSGKSFILKQLIKHLVKQNRVSPLNILYLNFEDEIYFEFREKEKLKELIDFYHKEIKKEEKTFYLLLDEIQEVSGWEKLVNSLIVNKNYDVEIFVTGSNSKLLSSELATYITGRYVEITVYGFNFDEYLQLTKEKKSFESLKNFLNSSQMPGFYSISTNTEARKIFIRSLVSSILMNDVIKRFKVKNVDLLEKILAFMIDNLANTFSLNSIQKKLKNTGVTISLTSLGNYIKYLEYSFLIFGVDKFNIKGKRILEGEKKYYLSDFGFRNFLGSSFDSAESKKLENFVFHSLISRGYTVHIGQLEPNLEIDFIAEKNSKKIYIQVTYFLSNEDIVNREYGNLEKIKDHWPKYVISMDDMTIKAKEGIIQIPAWQIESIL